MTTKQAGRREDQRLLTGGGRYSADFSLPGQLYAAFRRADRAHAAIRSIDKSAAEAAPDVVAVFIGRDVAELGLRTVPPMMPFPGRGGSKILVPERPLLPSDRVRYVGEEVAMVIATSAAAAADAAELVDIDYQDLPVVIGFNKALASDTPALHANIPGNICFDIEYGDQAKADAAFARAARIARATIESPRIAPTPMEPRAVLAWYDTARQTYRDPLRQSGRPRDARCARGDARREAGGSARAYGGCRRRFRLADAAFPRKCTAAACREESR